MPYVEQEESLRSSEVSNTNNVGVRHAEGRRLRFEADDGWQEDQAEGQGHKEVEVSQLAATSLLR